MVNIARKKKCNIDLQDFDNVSRLCVTTRELYGFTYKFDHSPRTHSLEVVDGQRKKTITAYLKSERDAINEEDAKTFLLTYYKDNYGV